MPVGGVCVGDVHQNRHRGKNHALAPTMPKRARSYYAHSAELPIPSTAELDAIELLIPAGCRSGCRQAPPSQSYPASEVA
jgi:hypothetical protein